MPVFNLCNLQYYPYLIPPPPNFHATFFAYLSSTCHGSLFHASLLAYDRVYSCNLMDCIFKFIYLAELLRGSVVRLEFSKHKENVFENREHIKNTL